MLHRIRISTLSYLLGAAVIGGFLGAMAAAYYTVLRFDIEGPISMRIANGNALTADVLPPPLYIAEAFLETTLVVREPWSVEPRKRRLVELNKEYADRRAFWLTQDIPSTIRGEIETGAHQPAAFFWDTLWKRFMPAIERGDQDAADAAYLALADAFANQRAKIESLVKLTGELNAKIRSEGLADERATIQQVAVLCGFILIMIAAAVAGVILGMVRPIETLRSAMQRLASGDRSVEIPYGKRHDEIGEMAKTLIVFRDNLAESESLRQEQAAIEARQAVERKAEMQQLASSFEQAVGSIVSVVATASTELGETAEQLTATSRATSDRSSAVAQASEEASRNVMTVATAAEQLSHSIREISSQVTKSSTMASKAAREAEETTHKVKGLSEAANRIGGIVELINQIASQTSLLALNATIEAARAGEAGRGFAVVAHEVKQLSERTAKATEEIAAQIGAIQEQTTEAAGFIDGIAKTVRDLDSIAASIASAVEQQGVATESIARNVEEASAGTTDVAQNISRVTEAAEGSSTSAMQVLGSARDLSEQAEALRREVDKFIATVRAA